MGIFIVLKSCIVVGSGAHCFSVISIIESLNEYNIVGIVNTSSTFIPNEIKSGYKVIDTIAKVFSDKDKYSNCNFAIAIGDNLIRAEIYHKLLRQGRLLPNFVSSSALIDRTSIQGEANIIAHNAVLGSHVVIGSNNLINTGAIVEHNSQVGSHCHIGPSSVLCGTSKVYDYCMTGANSTMLPKTTLAPYSRLGAGSVLTNSCNEEAATLVGVPARVR